MSLLYQSLYISAIGISVVFAPLGILALVIWLIGRLAKEGEKTYFVLPTKTLLQMVDQRVREYAERAGMDVRIATFIGGGSKKKREELEEMVRKGEFDILITTSQFLTRNFELVKDLKIDFAFIDDVDAFLRASKNIDRILQVIWFSEDIINAAYELIRAKISLVFRSNDRKLQKRVEELQKMIDEYRKKNRTGQIIVASATGRSQGLRVKLFRELLDFEIGSTRANLRNIVNTYETEWAEENILDIVRKMGPGGLIFVALDKGQGISYR
jgi:reverse gyrase